MLQSRLHRVVMALVSFRLVGISFIGVSINEIPLRRSQVLETRTSAASL